jgi:hypothetical protein
MGHDSVDEALSELGDWSLITEVNCYRCLECKHKSLQESIMQLEDQLFTTDVEHRMCVSRLEAASVTCRWHVRLDVSGIGSVAKLLEVSVLSTDPEPLLT